MKSAYRHVLGAVAALLLMPSAMPSALASTSTFTLPAFFNIGSDDPTALPTETIGTFTGLPTIDIIGATISGTFGTSDSQSSAGVDLFLDGLLVGQCNEGDACNNGTGTVPWSFTLTPAEFALLLDGAATLTGEQTSIGQINLDVTTLSVTVPEPASITWLSLPFAAAFAWRMRSRAA